MLEYITTILGGLKMTDTFLVIIERFGVSFSFLVFFVWCAVKSGKWLGEKIILPLQERHLQFLDKLEGGIDNVIVTQTKTLEILNQILLNTKEKESVEN